STAGYGSLLIWKTRLSSSKGSGLFSLLVRSTSRDSTNCLYLAMDVASIPTPSSDQWLCFAAIKFSALFSTASLTLLGMLAGFPQRDQMFMLNHTVWPL